MSDFYRLKTLYDPSVAPIVRYAVSRLNGSRMINMLSETPGQDRFVPSRVLKLVNLEVQPARIDLLLLFS